MQNCSRLDYVCPSLWESDTLGVAIGAGLSAWALLTFACIAIWYRVLLQRRAGAVRAERAITSGRRPKAVLSRAQSRRTSVDSLVLVAQAMAKVSDGQAEASHVRRRINSVAACTLMFSFITLVLVSLPGMPPGSEAVRGWLFPLSIVSMSVGGTAVIDPMLPRRLRTILVFFLFSAPIPYVAGWVFLAIMEVQEASLRSATTARVVAVGLLYIASAVVQTVDVLYLLPALYPAQSRLLAGLASASDYRRVLQEQRDILRAAGTRPSWSNGFLRISVYLLEGAGYFEMSCAKLVHRVHVYVQVLFATLGGTHLALAAVKADLWPSSVSVGYHLSAGLTYLICIFLFTTRGHRTVRALLGGLSRRRERHSGGALVAGLMGEVSADVALTRGRELFCALPFEALTQEDLSSTMTDSAGNHLSGKTVPLELGSCDAFVSHSWHDDPVAKWAALDAWAQAFARSNRGRLPTLWLDKACIDQQNIQDSLACLPVSLSGCRKLLVLVGDTYVERLWCVVEIFTFLVMGGTRNDITVVPIDSTAADIAERFRAFKVDQAKCFLAEDKDKLLAAIESAFGLHQRFDALVRTTMADCIAFTERTRRNEDAENSFSRSFLRKSRRNDDDPGERPRSRCVLDIVTRADSERGIDSTNRMDGGRIIDSCSQTDGSNPTTDTSFKHGDLSRRSSAACSAEDPDETESVPVWESSQIGLPEVSIV